MKHILLTCTICSFSPILTSVQKPFNQKYSENFFSLDSKMKDFELFRAAWYKFFPSQFLFNFGSSNLISRLVLFFSLLRLFWFSLLIFLFFVILNVYIDKNAQKWSKWGKMKQNKVKWAKIREEKPLWINTLPKNVNLLQDYWVTTRSELFLASDIDLSSKLDRF